MRFWKRRMRRIGGEVTRLHFSFLGKSGAFFSFSLLWAKHNNILLIHFFIFIPIFDFGWYCFSRWFSISHLICFCFTSGTLFLICITMSTNHIVSLFSLFLLHLQCSFLTSTFHYSRKRGRIQNRWTKRGVAARLMV